MAPWAMIASLSLEMLERWKQSWYHSRSREIVYDRDLLFSLFLSTWKKNFYSCSMDHMRIKVLEGKAISLRLINLPILHLRGRHNFSSFYSPLCSSIKYLNTQSCLRVLSSFYTVEVWISGFGKYIAWIQIVEFLFKL